MWRPLLCAMAVLGLGLGMTTAADDKKADDKKAADKKADNKKPAAQATITKIDPKNHTVTVKMKGKDGKETEKEFKLTEEVRYLDSTGRVAAADVFRSGDYVLVVEEEGRLKEMKQDKKGDKKPDGNKKEGSNK